MANSHRSSLTPPKQALRTAIYCRVSTLDQNVRMQLDELRQYARRRGFRIVKEFIDQGVSGAKESRPQLNGLMANAQQRTFDAVLVWKLDRFGRSLQHLVNALAEFEALGVAFISLRDNLDLGTPSGRLMFQIIGAMAEFERSLLRERTVAGIAAARRRGKKWGRPRVYLSSDRIEALRQEGMTWRAIGKKMKAGATTCLRVARGRR